MAPTKPGKYKKTDNAFLADKVALRSRHMPDSPIVLDCFAGEGTIWEMVKAENPEKKIITLSIEMIKNKGKFHLVGDNTRFLSALDLSVYNVIDLDSYGVPYKQLKIMFDRQYKGTVFFTFIMSFVGVLHHNMLYEIGFSETMLSKAKVLCFRHGWEKFKEYLALHGIEQVTYIAHGRKYYGYFIM